MKSKLLFVLLIFSLSLPIKFAAAQNMQFDIDIVPVLARNQEYFLSPVGTLSSVAAYNMPMLQWLHLPAFWLIGNAWWGIFLTMTLFGLLGLLALFQLSDSFFGTKAAYIVTALFCFSEVGISSSYTAWAQLLLPSFYALTVWALWEWHRREDGRFLALAGIIATAAFMTHFSAILLYPAMLIYARLNRSKWQWGWLGIGAIAVGLMLAPYLLFELQRDFVDLRAFLNQKTLVAPEILAQYRPEARPNQNQMNPQNQTSIEAAVSSSRLERAFNYLLSLPLLLWRALQAAFPITSRGLDTWAGLAQIVFALPMLCFWMGIPLALWRRDEGAQHYAKLGAFVGVILLAMAVTRNLDDTTYLMGMISVQTLMAGYTFTVFLDHETTLKSLRQTSRAASKSSRLFSIFGMNSRFIIFGLVLLFCIFQVAERAGRLLKHDDTAFSAHNVSLYRHIDAAAAAIAADWQGGETIVVSYDILPEMPNLWWTPAWNSIDSSYRMGMNFDFLLDYHYGLTNLNQDAVGTVANADYLVIYSPAAERYALENYEIWRFGAIWVLKQR